MESQRFRRHDTDFFFPILLITVGVIWMLVNQGVIAVENVYRLAPFWPVLLVAAGLSLLIRRLWWPLGALIWALLAAAILWALIAAPGILPQSRNLQFNEVNLREPVGQARAADVTLDLSISSNQIHALKDSQDLVVAKVFVPNDAVLDVTGSDPKSIHLRQTDGGTPFFLNFDWIGQNIQSWDIGLTTHIPLDLTIDASTGSTTADLAGMQLERLKIDASTGSMQVTLPQDQVSFPFELSMSTGSMRIDVPANTGFVMNADGSTGSVTIDIPDNAGLRVEVVSDGPGSMRLPDGMDKVRAGDGEEGVYENKAFATSKNPIDIKVDLSTGSFTIH